MFGMINKFFKQITKTVGLATRVASAKGLSDRTAETNSRNSMFGDQISNAGGFGYRTTNIDHQNSVSSYRTSRIGSQKDVFGYEIFGTNHWNDVSSQIVNTGHQNGDSGDRTLGIGP